MSSTYDVDKLRAEEFPWTQRGEVVYLNNAGTGPQPQRAVTALEEWAAWRTQPWRVPDQEVVFPALAHVRALCAKLIGARDTEIALVPNTSFGLSLAARSLPLKPGDVVLTSE